MTGGQGLLHPQLLSVKAAEAGAQAEDGEEDERDGEAGHGQEAGPD